MSSLNMDKRFKISKILINNYILILLMLIVTTHRGSNAFGYDSAASCNPNGKLSRRGRAQILAAIPCDLTRQAYCNLPGAAYPWHAVRRFVHENQGLMKRMYGDMRHISVLRDEIQNNEIDIEDIEVAAERYSRDGSRKRTSRHMQRIDDYYDMSGNGLKSSDIVMEPHFRPVSTMATKKIITTKSPKTKADDDLQTTTGGEADVVGEISDGLTGNSFEKTKPSLEHQFADSDSDGDDSNLASNSVYESPTLTANAGENIEIIESPKLNAEFQNISATLRSTFVTSSTTTTTTTTTTKIPATTLLSAAPPTSPPTTRRILRPAVMEIQRRRPQYGNRQRPTHLQQQQHKFQPSFNQYQIHNQQQKQNKNDSAITTTKESATTSSTSPLSMSTMSSKQTTKENESERISDLSSTATTTTTTTPPSAPIKLTATTSTQAATTVKGVGSEKSPPMPTSSTSEADISLKTLSTYSNHQQPSTEATAKIIPNNQPQQIPPATTTLSSTSMTSVRPKIELYSEDKLGKQPTTAANKKQPSSASSTSPSPSTSSPVGGDATVTKPPVLRDGQLYQDTVKQEQPAPTMNVRGVNACPVKEEVVAPFWANNTRGEVLALLNLYPFEQYVHWEKCTNEHKQMYCRDGCYCEQQFRLHRLLAYDPRNECRGIFSDWFRFPSCCICKCYNIPMDFRATSRSPRMQSFPTDEEETPHEPTSAARHPLEVAEEAVKRAIYDHATEDWYRPNDNFYDDIDDADADADADGNGNGNEYWED